MNYKKEYIKNPVQVFFANAEIALKKAERKVISIKTKQPVKQK